MRCWVRCPRAPTVRVVGERARAARRPRRRRRAGASTVAAGESASGSAAEASSSSVRYLSARTLSLTAGTIGGASRQLGMPESSLAIGIPVVVDLGPVRVVQLVQREAGVERVVEAHVVDRLVDRLLDEQRGHRRQLGDPPGELERAVAELVGREDLADHAEARAPRRRRSSRRSAGAPWPCAARTPTGGRSTRRRTCRGGCRPRRRSGCPSAQTMRSHAQSSIRPAAYTSPWAWPIVILRRLRQRRVLSKK